jgi:uncharacterized protein (TIRG00374 family)
MKKPLLKILLQWALALLLVVLLFLWGDVSQLFRSPDIQWGGVLLVFLSNVGFTLAHNFRWKEIVKNLSIPKGGNFFSLYRSLIDSYAIGKIIPMDVSLLGLRTYYLNRFEKMEVSLAVFSVLLDRLLDLILFLTVALPSFFLITGMASINQSFLILTLLIIIHGVIIFLKKGETLHFFSKIYRTVLMGWFSKIPFVRSRWSEAAEVEWKEHDFRLDSVIRITGWNYVKYIFLCLRFYFTGLALGVRLPLLQSFFFLPFVQLSGLINITPGGLGVVELGTYGALHLMGISQSQTLLFVIGQRILQFFIFIVLFVLNRLFYLMQSRWRRIEGLG